MNKKQSKIDGLSTIGVVVSIVIVALLIGGGVYVASHRENADSMMQENGSMDKSLEVMPEKSGDTMMEKEGDTMMDKKSGAGFSGMAFAGTPEAPLLDFVKADYDTAVTSGKLIVLYFYANWCPICKAEFPHMEQAFNMLPKGTQVIGFRVNYNDSDTDTFEQNLAKQFGVAYQHTKVFVKNGEKILKAPDSWDANRYLTEIAKAM